MVVGARYNNTHKTERICKKKILHVYEIEDKERF